MNVPLKACVLIEVLYWNNPAGIDVREPQLLNVLRKALELIFMLYLNKSAGIEDNAVQL